MKYPTNLMYLWMQAPINSGYFAPTNLPNPNYSTEKKTNKHLSYLAESVKRFSQILHLKLLIALIFSAYMLTLNFQVFGLHSIFFIPVVTLGAFLAAKMKLPQTMSGSKGIGVGPTENLSTFFLLMVGLLSSVFALVGNFGAQGFIPFALFVIGFIINQTAQKFFRQKPPPPVLSSGINTQSLTLIAGGIFLVLTINYTINYVYSMSFLLPPLSTEALAFSANYGYAPVYIYTTLFAISEEFLFRGVILYVAYNFLPKVGFFTELAAVFISSFGWMIYHLWVYGDASLVLLFVLFTGFVFGVITLRVRNILPATGIHIINNLVAAGLTVIAITGAL